MSQRVIGVMLMSFGTPATIDDVPDYLTRVRSGRPFPPAFVEEFKNRFRMIGGSPLLKITIAQANALQELLNKTAKPDERYRVVVGMRHAPPMIDEAMAHLAVDGVQEVIAIIMAPQQTPGVMAGYYMAVEAQKAMLGPNGVLKVAKAWHTEPAFLDGLTRRVREALAKLSSNERETVHIVMSAHSLPKVAVAREPHYTKMLEETATTLATRLALPKNRWRFCYQSAGQASTEEWLKPDLKEVLPQVAKESHKSVLIVPVQFLADHLEILYDIDIAAKADCEAVGLKMTRIEGLNTSIELIQALAEVVRRERTA